MCALGQKGGISEAATILYSTANVLVCIDVMTLAGLHNAIKRYCETTYENIHKYHREHYKQPRYVLQSNISPVDWGSSKSLIRRTNALTVDVPKPCTPFNFKGFGGSCVPSDQRLLSVVVVDGKKFEGSLCIVDDIHLPSEVLWAPTFCAKTVVDWWSNERAVMLNLQLSIPTNPDYRRLKSWLGICRLFLREVEFDWNVSKRCNGNNSYIQ